MTKVSKKIAPSINQANAWKLFERKLELLLANLNENSYLIISIKQSNQLIQFVAQGSYGTRVETISNHFLFEEEQLDSKQIASLIKIGWHSPTGTPEEATPEDDPDGSPNFFVDYPANTDFSEHAGLAVQTFAKILRVQHPRFLQIKAFDANGTKLNLKKLGLQVAPPVEQEAELKEGETLVLYTSCQ